MAEKADKMRGFTLLEITIAILILATSLVVLLGLQSSITTQTIRAKDRQLALLASREILSAMEIAQNRWENMDKTAPLSDILSEISEVKEERPEISAGNFTANIKVEDWNVNGIEEGSIKRISLTVTWGESPLDSVSTVYFIPGSGENFTRED